MARPCTEKEQTEVADDNANIGRLNRSIGSIGAGWPAFRRARYQPIRTAPTSSATTSAGGAPCAALPIPMMKRPRQPAVNVALTKSNACAARGVFGRVFRPIATAITPNGRLIANSHGQLPTARTADAIVGPNVIAVPTTNALWPKPRPIIRVG